MRWKGVGKEGLLNNFRPGYSIPVYDGKVSLFISISLHDRIKAIFWSQNKHTINSNVTTVSDWTLPCLKILKGRSQGKKFKNDLWLRWFKHYELSTAWKLQFEDCSSGSRRETRNFLIVFARERSWCVFFLFLPYHRCLLSGKKWWFYAIIK